MGAGTIMTQTAWKGKVAGGGRSGSEAGNVPSAAHRLALKGVCRLVHPTEYFRHPRQSVVENSVYPALQRRRTDSARAAGPLELHFDHARDHVGADQGQVSTVSLHGRAHQFNDAVELGQPIGPLL